MAKTRLRFSKTGRAKFISHLDLMRTMRRAFLRAGVELRYSEGFNPHPYISAALPLSVGSESVCELLDFEPINAPSSDFLKRINDALPEGLEALDVMTPMRKFNEIAWIEVRGRLFYETVPVRNADKLCEFIQNSEKLLITKKTKRGESELDVRPFIQSTAVYSGEDNELIVSAHLSAKEPVINPTDLLNALRLSEVWDEPNYSYFRRVRLYDKNYKEF